jgi:hypothetical protein
LDFKSFKRNALCTLTTKFDVNLVQMVCYCHVKTFLLLDAVLLNTILKE